MARTKQTERKAIKPYDRPELKDEPKEEEEESDEGEDYREDPEPGDSDDEDGHVFIDPSIKTAFDSIIGSGSVGMTILDCDMDQDIITWLEDVFRAGLEKGRQEGKASDKAVLSSIVSQ